MELYRVEWRTQGGGKLAGSFSLPDDDAAMDLVLDDLKMPFAKIEVWRGEDRVFAWEAHPWMH
ncbi:MAG: hypothetical protein ABSC92_09690 [Rhizomicrobium sp.]